MTIKINNGEYEAVVTRRRYGKQTFTWVDYFKAPNGVCYGAKNDSSDPFPCFSPKESELVELLQIWMKDGEKWVFERYERVFID